MKITEIILKRVDASEGMVLTNGEAYSTTIYLGKNDSIDNWHEITLEEYEKIKETESEENENV